MKSGFGCLFIFVFLIFFLILSAIGTLARIFFSFRNKRFGTWGGGSYTGGSYDAPQNSAEQQSSAKSEKIIKKNEGEYVDFEEIK